MNEERGARIRRIYLLSYDRALRAPRMWLDSWAGIGHVAVGMAIIDEGEANAHRRQ
jgi:hypothetical protein